MHLFHHLPPSLHTRTLSRTTSKMIIKAERRNTDIADGRRGDSNRAFADSHSSRSLDLPSLGPPPLSSTTTLFDAAATDTAVTKQTQVQPHPRLSTMSSSEFFSLSILQILSVLSFLTSILAVLRVGSGSLHRLSHRFDTDVGPTAQAPPISVNSGKHLWNWTGLPVSFSLGTLIGEEEQEEEKSTVGRYVGGSELVRMDWKVGRQRLVPTMHDSRLPLSMAKIIMSRHSQRRPMRLPRRMPGMPRPTPPSRLVESFV